MRERERERVQRGTSGNEEEKKLTLKTLPETTKNIIFFVQLGETLDGHDLDCIRVGPVEPGRPRVWIIARQHPGESSLFNGSGSEFF